MTRAFARIVSGRRTKWACVGVWIVLIGVFGPLGLRLQNVTNEDVALPAGSQSNQVNELLRTRFPGGDTRTLVLVYRRAGGLTATDRRSIVADAQAASHLALVGTPTVPFRPKPVPGLVSKQGDVAFTLLPLQATGRYDVGPTIDALRALPHPPGLEAHVTGDAALLNDVLASLKQSDKALLYGTVLLVLLLLMAVYRSPLLALIPLVTVAIAYSVASGIVYLLVKAGALTVDSTAVSLLLVLMFGAGTDYCLLLVSRYRAELRANKEKHGALERAVGGTSAAIAASGTTVSLALLAMLAASLGLNHTLGPVNAIGIAVVMLASLTLLPALLTLLGRRGFWPTSHRVAHGARRPRDVAPEASIWGRIGVAVRARPLVVLIGSVAVLVSCALGLLAYHPSVSPAEQFRQQTDSKRGFSTLLSRFPAGSLAPVSILVRRNGDPVRASDLAIVRRTIAANPDVASVKDSGRRSFDGRIAELEAVFSSDPYGPAALDAVRTLRHELAALPGGVSGIIGHGTAARLDYGDANRRDLRVVGVLVLAIVLLMLVALLRAVVAPLFLLASVVLSYFGSLGLSVLVFRLVFGQKTLDPLVPVLVFIFLVALGSDYTIFLMSSVREEAAAHGMRAGTLRALISTGPVITSAGLILAGTFATLTVLPIWILFETGLAVALGVLIDTFVVRSLLVPALAWLVGERAWWPSASVRNAPEPAPAPEPV